MQQHIRSSSDLHSLPTISGLKIITLQQQRILFYIMNVFVTVLLEYMNFQTSFQEGSLYNKRWV